MRASVLLLSFVACGEAPPEGAPSLAFLAPLDGATVCGEPLRIELEVRDFALVEPGGASGELPEESGHVDLTLNGQVVGMIADTVLELTADPGEYELRAELVTADHRPIDPPAQATVHVTVEQTACAG